MMDSLLNPTLVYSAVAKKIMRLLRPYEKSLTVMDKRRDSLCLYTKELKEKEAELFAAVQIIKHGVAFTVYNSGKSSLIFECLPIRLNRFHKSGNKFLFTKTTPELILEIEDLLSALFETYSDLTQPERK